MALEMGDSLLLCQRASEQYWRVGTLFCYGYDRKGIAGGLHDGMLDYSNL